MTTTQCDTQTGAVASSSVSLNKPNKTVIQDTQDLQDSHRQSKTFKEACAEKVFLNFIHDAVAQNEIDRDDTDNWRSELWTFTRMVKGYGELRTFESGKVFCFVEKFVKDCSSLGEEDPWLAVFGVSREEAAIEFELSWEKIRYIPGTTPLENALDMARKNPFPLSKHGHFKDYCEFVRLAYYLQRDSGNETVFLPCKALADLLDVTPKTISRYRQLAVKDGYLVEVAPAAFKPGCEDNKATEFEVQLRAK